MAKGKKQKSWAEQLADLEDPAPKELDPEDDAELEEEIGSESAGDDENLADAREHYVNVSKSKLRKPNGVDLGPQYTGESISRDALIEEESEDDPFGSHDEQEESGSAEYADPDEDFDQLQSDADEEIESDEAFESGDEEKFAKFTFRNSRVSRANEKEDGAHELENGHSQDEYKDDEINSSDSAVEEEDGESDNVDMDDEEGAANGDSDVTSISDGPTEPKADDRAALRRMMAEEQKTVAESLSKAAKADVVKGRAIKHQRTTFDSLLNTRIKLQKALIATNSMDTSATESNEHPQAIEAAEKAALKLWDTISDLRSSLRASTSGNLPLDTTTSSTHPKLSSSLWKTMQEHEAVNIPKRRANLTKWSQKTNPATALPRAGTFSQTPSHQPLTSVLDQHLSGSNAEKLIQKTRIPRSCAPIQASSRIPSSPSIYDDADFYTLLLRELVDQRMADSATNGAAPLANIAPNGTSLPSSKQFKVKKAVDTKASKGRKMRYTVQEKLQNFMAPEDLGSWGERQRAELFGSLFGSKVRLDEDEGVGAGGMEGEDEGGEGMEEGGGLRLFG